MQKVKEYYRRLIFEDIKKPRYKTFRKMFPWIVLSFLILQIVYYYLFFYNKIWKLIKVISFYHTQHRLYANPKAIMFAYDYLISFVLFLLFMFIFFTLSFIAFDSTQRNDIIRELNEEKKDALRQGDDAG